MRKFVAFEDVAEVVAKGKTRSTVILRSGLQVDLRVVPRKSWGAALHYFTGSKAHNIAIRTLGIKKGLKINEYGVFKGRRQIGGADEEEVFASVSLPWIPPELREQRGEIEAARAGKLPKLVTRGDLRGDLHAHSRGSDGRDSIERMAFAAKTMGYEYIALTDHSPRLAMIQGLTPQKLLRQVNAIDRLNEKNVGVCILKGIEVDILEDGSLDLPDEILEKLDIRVCAIHTSFGLSSRRQTQRILRAMDNRYFNILAHPSGRLIGTRIPMQFDAEAIIQGARERGCILEINSQPDRMDLADNYAQMVHDLGGLVAISTDAHSANDLGLIKYGISQARRGWIEARNVVNTRPWRELKKILRRAS